MSVENRKRKLDTFYEYDNVEEFMELDATDCFDTVLLKRNNDKKTSAPFYPNKKPSKHYDDDDDDDDFEQQLRRLLPPVPKNGNGNNHIVIVPEKQKIENVCKNPLCNHKTYEEDPTLHFIPNIKEIKTIYDIIELGKSFHCKKNTEYAGMNLRVMFNLVPPLTELSNLVGMHNVKEQMVNQILFFLQGSHNAGKCNKCTDCVFGLPCLNSQTEMLHTAITGPPGVGKTELGKILGKVYKEMGILSKGTFKLVTRSDLIAGYLGQTAIKTQKVIDEARGGVLFIDEAYSLGNSELRDSFSKECIDTLNQNLSERRDFLCIIAGYEKELEKCFFKYNDGLRRRFTFRYDMVPYNYSELLDIFEGKVHAANWKLCYDASENDFSNHRVMKEEMREKVSQLFKRNINNFPNFGGDIESLLLNCKIVHARRCVFDEGDARKVLSYEDIEKGLSTFCAHRKYEAVHKQKNKMANINLESKIRVYS